VVDPVLGERARSRLDLDGRLTHDGVAGERSDLCDLRPVVMAALGPAIRRWRRQAQSCTCWRMAWSASSRGASWRPMPF